MAPPELARASDVDWSDNTLGRALVRLALHRMPDDQPRYLLGDDTFARTHGNGISLSTWP